MKKHIVGLKKLGACQSAVTFAEKFDTLGAAWKACERGDWMLWFAGRAAGGPDSESRRKVVLCAVECARRALPIYEKRFPGDDRVKACLDAAEHWAKSGTGLPQLREARSACFSARAAAADAAYAAAYAAAAQDRVLADFAERVVQILIDMKAPGCQWLDLVPLESN